METHLHGNFKACGTCARQGQIQGAHHVEDDNVILDYHSSANMLTTHAKVYNPFISHDLTNTEEARNLSHNYECHSCMKKTEMHLQMTYDRVIENKRTCHALENNEHLKQGNEDVKGVNTRNDSIGKMEKQISNVMKGQPEIFDTVQHWNTYLHNAFDTLDYDVEPPDAYDAADWFVWTNQHLRF